MQQANNQHSDLLAKHFAKKSSILPARSGNICYGYDRVSSKYQQVNGNSLVWQFENIAAFAEKNNLIIKEQFGGTYESAQTDERKEFTRMIESIKKDKTVSAIIVCSYDRFSRSGANGIFLLENLRKLGVRIIAVTQKVESFTPTGNFQENLYMLLSRLDNDMRREKSIAGTKSMLQRGFWPHTLPIGYTNLNKNSTADKHKYIINEQGLLLRKAFEWKASGKLSNQQIIDKLKIKGLNITLRNMAWIFANPFYCGYIISSMLPGEVIVGNHPPLITPDLFLQVNNISKQHPVSGVPKDAQNDNLPLKIFLKDYLSSSPFTGYYNKKKNLYYYKTRDKGTKVNVSASFLNNRFQQILSSIEYNKKYKSKLKEILVDKLQNQYTSNQFDEKINTKRIVELQSQLDTLEERYVLGKIEKEQYDKFAIKYQEQIDALRYEIEQNKNLSSNLNIAIEKGLNIAENISQLWVSSNYIAKQKLQFLVFPDGMQYDKENKAVRTTRINTIFSQIIEQARVLEETKKDNLLQDCLFGNEVGRTGFEPATPWSQTKYSTGLNYLPNTTYLSVMGGKNRVLLLPIKKIKSFQLLGSFCGEGGIRTLGTV
jgi:site-specific DNA recombinase